MDIDEKLKEEIISRPFFKGRIVTASMVPVIKVGEEILVEVKAEELKRFDIIVFLQDKKLICHYLWNINRFVEPKLMQTRNISGGLDFPIAESDYIGKVVSHRMPWWRILKITLFG